ncbi:extracellular solute-binding protein [Candidatus Haliotispira prima]|uniref:Extracellular solute-binding protein n=1 Tax=Candidatus Haliotispira prima TaxID=3034016 RepID=A0ABY8MHJ4_9SPIO|nr:extracellular solute-binding protein [Candidatus Haliotispira prima]
MKKKHALQLIACTIILLSQGAALWARGSTPESGQTVNVYSGRHYDIDTKLYEAFTKKTGIAVNVVAGNAGETVERAVTEGKNTQADVFFVTGADVLYQLKVKGILGQLPGNITSLVPENLSDPDGTWVAASKRARVIVYDKNKNPTPLVTDYENLVQGEHKVVIRSSGNSYNRMLLASIIHANGEAGARQWVRDLVSHMARPPQGNDRSQAKAVVAGIADYAVMNTYYLGLMLRSQDPKEVMVGESLGIIFPNQTSRGTHVNISGLAISKYAGNRSNAIALIEFLLSKESQQRITDENFEYPANASVKPNKLVASWGEFREDTGDLNRIAAQVTLTAKIADEEGWQ